MSGSNGYNGATATATYRSAKMEVNGLGVYHDFDSSDDEGLLRKPFTDEIPASLHKSKGK
jgi:hypothetical protein